MLIRRVPRARAVITVIKSAARAQAHARSALADGTNHPFKLSFICPSSIHPFSPRFSFAPPRFTLQICLHLPLRHPTPTHSLISLCPAPPFPPGGVFGIDSPSSKLANFMEKPGGGVGGVVGTRWGAPQCSVTSRLLKGSGSKPFSAGEAEMMEGES